MALQPCGTYGAYQRHLKANEPVDEACAAARDEYMEEYRERTRGRTDKRHSYASHRAARELRKLHPAQYKTLYAKFAGEWEKKNPA